MSAVAELLLSETRPRRPLFLRFSASLSGAAANKFQPRLVLINNHISDLAVAQLHNETDNDF